jgi:hypothetical protein
MDIDANNPFNALESLGMVWAYTYKMMGAEGIFELFGDKLTGREYVQAWATKLRAMRLLELADLLDKIANTMPPAAILVAPAQPHGFDREQDIAWARYVASHQDDERVVEHDRRWKQARADWLRQSGATPPYVI